jgi:hypothetical protein
MILGMMEEHPGILYSLRLADELSVFPPQQMVANLNAMLGLAYFLNVDRDEVMKKPMPQHNLNANVYVLCEPFADGIGKHTLDMLELEYDASYTGMARNKAQQYRDCMLMQFSSFWLVWRCMGEVPTQGKKEPFVKLVPNCFGEDAATFFAVIGGVEKVPAYVCSLILAAPMNENVTFPTIKRFLNERLGNRRRAELKTNGEVRTPVGIAGSLFVCVDNQFLAEGSRSLGWE